MVWLWGGNKYILDKWERTKAEFFMRGWRRGFGLHNRQGEAIIGKKAWLGELVPEIRGLEGACLRVASP